MTKSIKNIILLSLIVLGGMNSLSAQKFKYELKIPATEESGYHQLVLPASAMGKLDLEQGDLRLFEMAGDSTKKEIPYVLEPVPRKEDFAVEWVPFRAIPKKVSQNRTDHSLWSLKHNLGTVEFDEIKIDFKAPEKYFRNAEVKPESGEVAYGWSVTLENQSELIDVSRAGRARGYQLDVSNEDNAPLGIDSVKGLHYRWRIIAELDTGSVYAIHFGNPVVKAPKYDLRHFRDEVEIMGEPVLLSGELTSLVEEVPAPVAVAEEVEEVTPWYESKTVIWIALVVIVILLGGMTLKLLKKV